MYYNNNNNHIRISVVERKHSGLALSSLVMILLLCDTEGNGSDFEDSYPYPPRAVYFKINSSNHEKNT